MNTTLRYDCAAAKYEYPSSRYMTVGATRVHYCVEGRGPTLLLVHGLMASLHAWDGWARNLAPHYRIVRIDLPGFGLSDHLASDDYTPEYALELVEQVRAQLHLDRFHIAGSSLGGFFAWYYAARYPERVDRLILLDPMGYPQKLPSLVALLSLPGAGEVACLTTPRFLVANALRMIYGDPTRVTDALLTRYHELLARADNRATMVRSFRRLREYRNDAELSRQIPRVRAPTLLMWGGRDRLVPLALLAQWRRDLPMAEARVYPEAGHFPMEELPDETARDAHAFLSAGRERSIEPTERGAPAQLLR